MSEIYFFVFSTMKKIIFFFLENPSLIKTFQLVTKTGYINVLQQQKWKKDI